MVTSKGASGSHSLNRVRVVSICSREQRPGSDAHLDKLDRQMRKHEEDQRTKMPNKPR